MKQVHNCLFFISIVLLSCKTATEPQKNISPPQSFDKLDIYESEETRNEFPVSQDSLISQLPRMQTTHLDCAADVYWKIIKRGKASIVPLIESLTDTTETTIYDPCKNGRLTIVEVAYFALEEIAEFPAFAVTHIQFDYFNGDCWSFFEYLFDHSNKHDYQNKVSTFYQSNQFTYSKFKKSELTACHLQYEIEGKYKLQNM